LRGGLLSLISHLVCFHGVVILLKFLNEKSPRCPFEHRGLRVRPNQSPAPAGGC
jgi:hypothetical protein